MIARLAHLFILLLFWNFLPIQSAQAGCSVQLPDAYTAMKGDIAVSYSLATDEHAFRPSSFKSFNAMIHIEYLPGDSVLTNSHTATPSLHLARY